VPGKNTHTNRLRDKQLPTSFRLSLFFRSCLTSFSLPAFPFEALPTGPPSGWSLRLLPSIYLTRALALIGRSPTVLPSVWLLPPQPSLGLRLCFVLRPSFPSYFQAHAGFIHSFIQLCQSSPFLSSILLFKQDDKQQKAAWKQKRKGKETPEAPCRRHRRTER